MLCYVDLDDTVTLSQCSVDSVCLLDPLQTNEVDNRVSYPY